MAISLAIIAAPYDGANVTLSVLVLNPVSTAVLLARGAASRRQAARISRRCFGRGPGQRLFGAIGILVIIGVTDALLLASGRAIVSQFQEVAYTTAATEGWLPLMWFATVIVAPAGEEIMFRGYLFRGWVRSRRGGMDRNPFDLVAVGSFAHSVRPGSA